MAEHYEQISTKNRCFRSSGVSLTQIFMYKGSSPTNHSSCEKTRWISLSYSV